MQYAIFKLWVQKMMLALRAGLRASITVFSPIFFFLTPTTDFTREE